MTFDLFFPNDSLLLFHPLVLRDKGNYVIAPTKSFLRISSLNRLFFTIAMVTFSSRTEFPRALSVRLLCMTTTLYGNETIFLSLPISTAAFANHINGVRPHNLFFGRFCHYVDGQVLCLPNFLIHYLLGSTRTYRKSLLYDTYLKFPITLLGN